MGVKQEAGRSDLTRRRIEGSAAAAETLTSVTECRVMYPAATRAAEPCVGL
jgi:hypothetical protein